jgi:hypothetical protein
LPATRHVPSRLECPHPSTGLHESIVHVNPSSHRPVPGVNRHPAAGSQASSVQVLPSEQSWQIEPSNVVFALSFLG